MPPVAKPVRKQTVRLPPELWTRLKTVAEANRRSVNNQIVVTLEEALPGGSWVSENHPSPATAAHPDEYGDLSH